MKTLFAPSLLAFLALAPAAMRAQELDKDVQVAYSHAIPLSVSGKQAVVQLRLPQAVYLHAQSADLRDLRVFDATGRRMAHTIRQAQADVRSERRSIDAKVFPVFGSAAQANALAGLDLRTSADGTIVSLTTRTRAPASPQDQLASLVLDLRENGQAATVDALVLALPPDMKNYSATVQLEVSEDLKRWDMVAQTDLNWLLNKDSNALASNRIEFAAQPVRYARLRWQAGTPLQFSQVRAESPLHATVPPPQEKLLLTPQPGRFPNDLVYSASAAIPVRQLGLVLSGNSVVLPAQLGRYVELPAIKGRSESSWRFEPVLSATFYRLEQDGKVRASGDVTLPATHQTQWVLRSTASLDSKPTLRLAWEPSTLYFLTSGSAPYTLVFGRKNAKAAQQEMGSIAPGFSEKELVAVEQAVPGALLVQQAAHANGPSEAEMAARSARMRTAMLWAALLGGVAVLGVMVWKLSKQMKT